jgi:hypothetical protein
MTPYSLLAHLLGGLMLWIIWALMLVSHGALSRWARQAGRFALMATLGDALLIVIGLLTVYQLQGLEIADFPRVGLFFVAFGVAGQQLMHSVLPRNRSRG